MKAILIPVKAFKNSKKRLATHFSQSERDALAHAMCEDFFGVVAKVRGPDRIFVVSDEPRALHLAQGLGWKTIVETEQRSESHSVDTASRQCAVIGVTSLLRLPIDIPLAQPDDIEEVLNEASGAPSIVIVPSRDGTGTNALLRSPPDLFPSHFGPGSFALHVDEAERCGASVKILRNPRIALDIDDIDDLRLAAKQARVDSRIAQWLAHRRLATFGGEGWGEGITGKDRVPPAG